MFRRRNKLHPLDWARNMVWPRIGWRRTWYYWMARMGRLPGTENSLAIGFAFGAAMSFTPFVGFHIVLAAFLSLIFRGNIIASAFGTIVGNPWTFPFIWIWLYNVGIWLGFERPAPGLERVDFATFFGNMLKTLLRFDLNYLAESTWPILGPMVLGSIPTVVVAWIMFFLAWRLSIRAYWRARNMRPGTPRERR